MIGFFTMLQRLPFLLRNADPDRIESELRDLKERLSMTNQHLEDALSGMRQTLNKEVHRDQS